MLAKRRGLVNDKVSVLSAVICSKLTLLSQLKKARKILLYLPIKNEVDTKFIISFLAENHASLFLPAYDGESWRVCAYKPDDRLDKGPFEILQPTKIKKASVGDIDLAILPGIAFSKSGQRIGYGKGIYDRLLKSSSCTKVGICYDFQIVNSIRAQSHDISVDFVVSEKRIMASY